MAIAPTSYRKLTYEDYLLLPEDGRRHEILDGQHAVTASPFTRHQRAVVDLLLELGPFIREHRLGEILTAPLDVVLSEHDVVQPDLIFIAKERAAIVAEKNIQGAPDLVIEILSGGTRKRDTGIKRDRYALFGVREYWLVDPARRTIQVDLLTAGRFRRPALLSAAAGDVLTSPLFPGLEIPLARLLSAAP